MKKIKVELSTKSIDRAIKEIEEYQDSIPAKCRKAVSMLLDKGIKVARGRVSSKYSSYISFSKEFEYEADGIKGTLVCTDRKIYREWKTGGYEISPMLLEEFGSGWLASVLDDVPGVGQGTMPGQKHAFDTKGWWWEDEDGKHHSYGENPTHPMHNALLEMEYDIYQVFKEVFNE